MKQQIPLEEAIASVRNDEAPSAVAAAAAARVWTRVAHEAGVPLAEVETIRGCADVQALLPAHREGTLAPARALLVEDHLRECAACRAAFQKPGSRRLSILPWRSASAAVKPGPRRLQHTALAAAALLAVAITGLAVQRAFFAIPPGSRASVQAVSGALQRVADARTPPLQPGQEVGEAEAVRTARASRAHLKLRDGSIVEMGERAELSVTVRGNDTTIHLQRGHIIVQAAKRRTGHLLVASKDCTVHVTGTVFSVNGGLKGSRVSVIEGLVRVVGGGDDKLLQPGEQWSTNAAMGSVPMSEEIAWSRDLDQHLALLGEVQALREKWASVQMPGLRYQSRLLDVLPEGAVVFASLPNYGQALADAHRLFEERLQESPVLREWWDKADPARSGGPNLATLIDKVHSFADFLGDEVAFAAVADGRRARPFLLAEVRRLGLREFIEAETASTDPSSDRGPVVQILDDSAGSAGPRAHIFVLLLGDLIAVSPDAASLRLLAQEIQAGGGLERTPFGQRIADAYRDGVGLLFAADFERITQSASLAGRDAERFHSAGVDGLRHLIVERKQVQGQAHTEALLGFAGPRRGIASWLAAPGPMGALDFVSPNAEVIAAFLSKSPSLVLDDILSLVKSDDTDAQQKLADLQSKLDLRIREDLAETLGGEFAIALDGPILPTPAWKVIVEVYDPVRLQTSLQVLVNKANDEAARAGRPPLRLEAEQVGARTYYSLRAEDLPIELHYTFADGYWVVCPSRALVMQALRARDTGEALSRSADFRGLFPGDRQDHVSGVMYQNLGPMMGSFMELSRSAQLSPDQRRSLDALGRSAKASLVCAYGLLDGIQVSGTGGSLDLDPTSLALPLLLGQGLAGTVRREAP